MVSIPRPIQWLPAPVGTVVLFLVLYNNCEHGLWVLFFLTVTNLVWVVVSKTGTLKSLLGDSGFPAVLAASVVFAWLLVECLFPSVAPRDFAAIKDLSKSFMGMEPDELKDYPVVFENTDQRIHIKPAWDAQHRGKYRFWHQPGKTMEYFGYEPNEKWRYINLIRWNAMGYYDHDYPMAKPPGAFRIVVIGDSYVESIQVPLAKTFHKLLEAHLNSSSSLGAARKFEVIAIGNSGNGQVDNLRDIKSQGLRYAPDLVLMTLCYNDFCDDDPELSVERDLFSGQMSPLCRGLVRHGYMGLAFAVRRVEEIRRNRIAVNPEILQWSAETIPRVERAWDRTLDQVRQSRDLCSKSGAGFALVYLSAEIEVRHAINPSDAIADLKAQGGPYASVEWDLTRSVKRVEKYCQVHGIGFISLLGPLAAAQKDSGKKVFGDHYSMFGHETVAAALGRAVELRVK